MTILGGVSTGVIIVIQIDKLTADFSTTSTSKVAITGLSITVSSSGHVIIQGQLTIGNAVGGNTVSIDLFNGSVIVDATRTTVPTVGHQHSASMSQTVVLGSETYTLRMAVDSNTGIAEFSSTTSIESDCSLQITEFQS